MAATEEEQPVCYACCNYFESNERKAIEDDSSGNAGGGEVALIEQTPAPPEPAAGDTESDAGVITLSEFYQMHINRHRKFKRLERNRKWMEFFSIILMAAVLMFSSGFDVAGMNRSEMVFIASAIICGALIICYSMASTAGEPKEPLIPQDFHQR